MSGYVDIHAHLLPGIDDGPPDLHGALEMARAAAGAGTQMLVATPHLRSDFPNVRVHELAARCQSMREALQREGIGIQLVCGAEVSLLWALEASDEELRLASYGQLGTDLLIETPTADFFGLDRLLQQLRTRGFRITLAHPERNLQLHARESLLQELVDQGLLLQINAESLLGTARRSGPGRIARELCSEGLVHALASDGHRSRTWRPVTHLEQAVAVASALVGRERAAWIAKEAPAAIIGGLQLPDPPAISLQRRGPRLFRPRPR